MFIDRCIGKTTRCDINGRISKSQPSCGWEGEAPQEQTNFCPQCGGRVERDRVTLDQMRNHLRGGGQ